MNITDELVNDFPNAPYTEQDIRDYMERHPDIFQWFFQEPGGDHSENLIQSDLSNTFVTILRLTDLIPGTMFRIVFDASGDYNSEDHQDIIIGATGNYYADELRPIYGVYLIKDSNNTSNFPISASGAINYQYRAPTRTEFNSIVGTAASVGEYSQFVGEVEDLVESLQSKRNEITTICMSRYFKRPVEYLFYKGLDLSGYTEDLYINSYDLTTGNYKELQSPYKDNLYWDTNYVKTFNDKEGQEHSPFSIYVLKNSYVTVNGIKQSLLQHIEKCLQNSWDEQTTYNKNEIIIYKDENKDKYYRSLTDNNMGHIPLDNDRFWEDLGPVETHTHVADHMFEKYYIDRYIFAQSAENMLTERMALAARISASQDIVEKSALVAALKAEPIYVVDPVAGKVYKAGENYFYNPAIIYNSEEIDLREIQRYDLDNLEPTETKIQVGNGVYGDIFYHNIETFYTFEDLEGDLKEARDAYNAKLTELRNKKWPNWPNTEDNEEADDPSRQELDDLEDLRIKYCELLETAITEWKSRETDLE